MRKIVNFWMLVAFAATVSAACSKADAADDESSAGSENKSVRGFVAEIAMSRTTFDSAWSNLAWSDGDRLGVYTSGGAEADLNVASSSYTEGAANFTAVIGADATMAYAYYPYDAGQTTSYGYMSTNLPIAQNQTQTQAGVLAGAYVPMSAAAALEEGVQTVLRFQPAASLIAFDIYDAENGGDRVQSVTFTPAGGVKINGNRYIDMTTGEAAASSPDGYYASATVTLTTPYEVPAVKSADRTGYIYLAVTPKVYAGGTFTVVTDKDSYTFETAKELDLTNVYNVFTIPMNLGKAAPAPDYSGTYVILAKEGTDYSALAGTNANNSSRLDAVAFAYDGEASVTTTNPAIVWKVEKTGAAYTVSNEGKYLTCYTDLNNSAKVADVPCDLLVAKNDDGTYNIASAQYTNRILAKYNAMQQYFAFYNGTGTKNLYLIPVTYIALPSIDLETGSILLEYDDSSVHELSAAVSDAATVQAGAYADEDGTEPSDWLEASYADGKISYRASANDTGKARTAYIVVSAANDNGTQRAVVAVTQNMLVQGTEVSFVYAALYSDVTDNADVTEDTVDGVTARYVKISGSNAPKYYNNGQNLRIYNKSTMTVTAPAGSQILQIEFTASKWPVNSVSADVGTLTSKTWTGESQSVVFTFTGSFRIESFVVTYK